MMIIMVKIKPTFIIHISYSLNLWFQIVEEDKLQQNSKEVGSYFIKQLLQLQKIHPIVGDVRGQGLMLGAELVVPHTKEPLPGDKVADIIETLKDLGVLIARGGRWNNVRTAKKLAQLP